MTKSVIDSGSSIALDIETTVVKPGSMIGLLSTTKFWFWFSVVTVSLISFYDAYLVYEYRHAVVEQNPICKWLIDLEPNSVIMFLLGKSMGTLGVVAALIGLRKFWRPVSFPVALSLVVFQFGLMVHIHTSDDLPESRAKYAQSVLDQQKVADRHWADELFEREFRRAQNRNRRMANRRRAASNQLGPRNLRGAAGNRPSNSSGRTVQGNGSGKPVPIPTGTNSDRRR